MKYITYIFQAAALLALAMLCAFVPVARAQGKPSIRSVQVLRTPGQVEVEIEASDRVVPHTNVLANPDRLVVDFVNAVPGAQLRNQTVNRAEVKSVRVGLFSSDPPVTRIVLDLNGAQPYQVFPSGRTVIVKVGGAETQAAVPHSESGPHLVNTSLASQPVLVTAPAPKSVPVPVALAAPRLVGQAVLPAAGFRAGADHTPLRKAAAARIGCPTRRTVIRF